MSKLKIYGIPTSRALRSLWMAEELGLDYENVKIDWGESSKTPEYLSINPNGRVPAMDDNGLVLFESIAINLYLVEKFPDSELAPRNIDEKAKTYQWSIWGLTELEKATLDLVLRNPDLAFLPPDKAIEDAARETLARPLKVLEAHLNGRDWLVADRFMAADLNLAAVMYLLQFSGFDMSAYTNVKRWLDTCLARPGFANAQAA